MKNQSALSDRLVYARYVRKLKRIVFCLHVLTVIVALSVLKEYKNVCNAIKTFQKYTRYLECDIFIKEYQKLGSSPKRVLTGIFLSYRYCSKR